MNTFYHREAHCKNKHQQYSKNYKHIENRRELGQFRVQR